MHGFIPSPFPFLSHSKEVAYILIAAPVLCMIEVRQLADGNRNEGY